MKKAETIYESIGGAPTVDKIIESLYKHIDKNEVLRPIFPKSLVNAARKQKLFLTQFLGGEPLYTRKIGRPMLPVRHAEFEITPSRRDAWLNCMKKALIEAEVPDPYFTEILHRLMVPAHKLVNTEESTINDKS